MLKTGEGQLSPCLLSGVPCTHILTNIRSIGTIITSISGKYYNLRPISEIDYSWTL